MGVCACATMHKARNDIEFDIQIDERVCECLYLNRRVPSQARKVNQAHGHTSKGRERER